MDVNFAEDPVSVLRRIAFLLERAREESYKVKAYRGAASAIAPLSAGDVAARVQAGTLQDLPGVGRTTALVIAQAVRGEVPERLQQVEEEYGGPLTRSGHTIRAALRGDLHSHSDWSDGGSPPAEMARTAMEIGHDYLVLSDHSPRLTIAHGLSAERLVRQLELIDELNASIARAEAEDAVDHAAAQAGDHAGEPVGAQAGAKVGGRVRDPVGEPGFRLLRGIEVDILDDGSLDQREDLLERLDLRVASVHSKLAMDPASMTRRMIAAVQNPLTNVLGHCTGRLVGGDRGIRGESQFDARAVFEACAAHRVAVEINARPERRDPPSKLIELAAELGCLFAIDSDAHAPGQLDLQVYGCERAEEIGLDSERIVNTWPLERLLAWSAG